MGESGQIQELNYKAKGYDVIQIEHGESSGWEKSKEAQYLERTSFLRGCSHQIIVLEFQWVLEEKRTSTTFNWPLLPIEASLGADPVTFSLIQLKKSDFS